MVRYIPILLLVLASCNPCNKLIDKYNKGILEIKLTEDNLKIKGCEFTSEQNVIIIEKNTDTTITYDTTFTVKNIFVKDTVIVDCDKLGRANSKKSIKRSGGVKVTTEVIDGRLKIQAECDSLIELLINRDVTLRKTVEHHKQEVLKLKADERDKGFREGIRMFATILGLIILLLGIGYTIKKLK